MVGLSELPFTGEVARLLRLPTHMNPILVSQSVCCLKSKSSRLVFAASAVVAAILMALASAASAAGSDFAHGGGHFGHAAGAGIEANAVVSSVSSTR